MKGADHVLSERVIDRGLSADRRIHLCEQRGRDLNEGHTALIGGGGESRQIPDYPTPQRDECGITRASLLEQRIEDPIKGAPILVFLAVGNDDADHLDVLTGQRSSNASELQPQPNLVCRLLLEQKSKGKWPSSPTRRLRRSISNPV